jgi:nucleoside-diphosphate-sugar epimerase
VKTLAITGANGFIGNYLCRHFSALSYEVIALSRRNPEIEGVHWHPYNLEQNISLEILARVDVILHLAFALHSQKEPQAYQNNIAGCKLLLENSRLAKVPKVVYFSSMSAHSEAISMYGKHKWEAEKLFDGADCLVIRPGLVLGEGGMLKKIGTMVKKSPIVPLIGGGNQPIQTLSLANLAAALTISLKQNSIGILNFAANEPISTRKLYEYIIINSGKKPRFLQIPYLPIYWAASIAENLGIQLPISIENLKGLKKLKIFDCSQTQTELNFKFEPIEQTLPQFKTYLTSL